MTESIIPKKVRFLGVLSATALLMIALQGVCCQSASAQVLLNRIRARIEARMAFPPPPLGRPVPGYGAPEYGAPGYGLPANELRARGAAGRPSSQYRGPDNVPASGDQASSRQPRVLATPTPQQFSPPGYSLAKPPIDDSSIMSSPIEQAGYQASLRNARPNPNSDDGRTLARPRASLGISARDARPQRGVIVVEVNDGSAGKIGGIQVNDRIVSAAGRLIRDTSGLIRELALSQPGDSITLGVVRGDAMRELTVAMGDRDGKLVRGATDVATSAAEQSAPESEQSVPKNTANSENSLFNGVGSALGNFFGGGSSQQMNSAKSTDDAVSGQADQVFELPAPAPEPEPPSGDPLALPDDE